MRLHDEIAIAAAQGALAVEALVAIANAEVTGKPRVQLRFEIRIVVGEKEDRRLRIELAQDPRRRREVAGRERHPGRVRALERLVRREHGREALADEEQLAILQLRAE